MSANGSADLPISKELLDILRCPQAVQEPNKYGTDPGRLELVKNSWLVSADSGLKYPIRNGIPIMLIDEGMKWKNTAADNLPVPPPAATPAGSGGGSTAAADVSSKATFRISKKMIGLLVGIAVVVFFLRKKS